MLRFDPCELPAEAERLRDEVREFLGRELAGFPGARRALTWSGSDPDFSRKVGARGWIGMTWPRRYGGGERSALERYVVLEEMLVTGAPVGAHWVADRQSGPLLLRYGSEEQRRRYLPGICRGQTFFCIGMSEPDSGSDLASIRTRAERVPGGWRLDGSKLWTSGAHRSDVMVALVRTGTDEKDRHAGLSQFLVDLRLPGITVRPIRDLTGSEHFCEVVFEGVALGEDALVGREGQGWEQVTTELALERSGPERYLACYPLLARLVDDVALDDDRAAVSLGHEVATLVTLREMSLAVAGMLERGESPALEAALVKDIGSVFEQAIPDLAHELLGVEPRLDGGDDIQQMLAVLTQNAPSFSLRGGTREILRGIIARGLGLR